MDGTSFGEQALPLAAAFALQLGAELRIVHAISDWELAAESPRLLADPGWVSEHRDRKREYLDGLVRRVLQAYSVCLSASLLEGTDVVEAVCAASATADLLVLTTRERGAWARLWRGSNTVAIGRRARCPVLLVRGRDTPPDFASVRLPRTILIPLDGTERGEEALQSVGALGVLAGARCELLHVTREWTIAGDPSSGCVASIPGALTEGEARPYLRERVNQLRAAGIPAVGRVTTDNRPIADAIVEAANRSGAELVVLTTRGRGPLSRFFRGSIAEDVTGRVGVPVLLTNTRFSSGVAGRDATPSGTQERHGHSTSAHG